MASNKLLLLCCFLFMLFWESQATTEPKPKNLLLPLSKDSLTLQYTTQLHQRTPPVPIKLVVYLGAPFLWVDCDDYISSTYRPTPCGSHTCKLGLSGPIGGCTFHCYGKPVPGCHNNTCLQTPDKPYIHVYTAGQMGRDVVSVASTDGRAVTAPQVAVTCVGSDLLEGLATGAKGMAGFGRTAVSLPSEFSSAFGIARTFSLCLAQNGVVFFGDGPYYFRPNTRISSRDLTFTPLIFNPISVTRPSYVGEPSSEYFINVTAIKVNGKPLEINRTLLKINEKGFGGTMLSTTVPYSVMQRSIYRALVNALKEEAAHLKKVDGIEPFEECFSVKNVTRATVGPAVPRIDLVLHKEDVIWKIWGANSMVFVKKDVMCLGIIDGGINPTTSVVIGAHQLEENFLRFDLSKSILGFSSSLLLRDTACSNFNFTSSG